MAEDYRSTAQRLSSGQSRLADSFGQQQTTPSGGIGLLSTALGPARFGASAAIRSFDDIRNLLGVLSTANKTNPVRKLIANELAAAEVAKRLAQPTALNAAKRATALVPVAGAMQAGSDPLGPLPPGMRPPAPYIKEAIPGRPGTEVGAGMPLPPLKQKMDQANATGTPSVMPYVEAGTDQAQNARERSFLERLSQSGLLSTLQGMARAERQYGVGPLAAFSESALDVQAARSAAEQAAAETQAKVDIERLKNQPKPPKLSAEAVKLYDRVNTSRANAALVQKMKQALIEGPGTGAIGTGEQALIAMMNALNLPIGTSGRTDYNSLLAQLKTGLLRSGRLLKADFELLEKQLPKSGTFTNREQLLNALRKIEEKSNRQLYEDQQILKTIGLPAGSGAMPSTMIRSRNN